MIIVMFHSGKSFPVFLEDNFKQLRLFNPDIPIYFLTDREWLGQDVFFKYNIVPIDKSNYASDDIRTFGVLFGRGENDFWTITTTRFMYIANFLQERNFHDVYHFENDVLLYIDLAKFNSLFCKLYLNLAITIGGPDKAMTGLMFIKNPQALCHMTSFFINLLKNNKCSQIRKIYETDMVNEMTLMRIYSKEYPDKMIPFPILPFGEWSKNYEVFNSIFDPASWGQFVGGTTDGISGAKPEDHYIGQLLREHPEYNVIWKLGIPYFKYDEKEVKINNLHIHSKNLNKYLS